MPTATTDRLDEASAGSRLMPEKPHATSRELDSKGKGGPSSDTAHPPRYHDMDSLRAAMMLLGIVFHAAWFFIPVYYGNTLSDVSGSWSFSYFFGWVHQFRMQTFFLIAGFFACLLVHKRGVWSFAKNRGMRILLPLLLCMVTLWPLMKLQYLRGGLISGRILSDEPLLTQYWKALASVKWESEPLRHLWFLYTLIVLYAVCWLLRVVFDFVLDRQHRIRPALEKVTNAITDSHFGPFVLAIPVALCMAIDLTWFGIFAGNLKPMWLGVGAYWVFFAVGWCLFSQPEIINRFVSRWPAYVIAGSILSLLLCGFYHTLLISGRQAWAYPAITSTEIDYPSLRSKLLAASETAEGDHSLTIIWNALSPTYQQFVRERPTPTSDQLAGFARALSAATVFNREFQVTVSDRDADSKAGAASKPFSGQAAVDLVATTDTKLTPVQNRESLSGVLAGDVTGFFNPPMWLRIAYFYGYCVATWLLVFGMLGLFRQFMSHPSPTARYLADSSYWLFLIHLPIQFELSLYFAQWEANGLFKFLVYNLVAFAIALPTYHYLVRSTWLGVLLNGRMYPLSKPKDWLTKIRNPQVAPR